MNMSTYALATEETSPEMETQEMVAVQPDPPTTWEDVAYNGITVLGMVLFMYIIFKYINV